MLTDIQFCGTWIIFDVIGQKKFDQSAVLHLNPSRCVRYIQTLQNQSSLVGMRGSSSELLLDARCSQCQNNPGNCDTKDQEQRRRKLLEFEFGASRRRPPRRTFRQRFNFYATSALALVATSGGAALLFLVPLYVDPAISTLAANFSPEPVTCTTSRREDLAGLFNCTWSSCREGCTSDVYKCTHIYVTYNPWSNLSATNETEINTMNAISTLSTSSMMTSVDEIEAVLMVNIKGCGYPPTVYCENFTRELGYEGAKFPCHYSRVNSSIVMADYNREAHVATIMHFFAAPFVVTLATSVALCVMHCDCRCSAPSPKQTPRGMRRPRPNDLRIKVTHRACGLVAFQTGKMDLSKDFVEKEQNLFSNSSSSDEGGSNSSFSSDSGVEEK